MADGKRSFGSARLLGVAALAGVLAGAAAVYVSGRLAGNTPTLPGSPAIPAQTASTSPDDLACAAKAEKAKALGAAATGEVAAMMPADPPLSVRALSFSGPNGTKTTLADFGGKTVLLNLWATWCAPCRAEMPALDRLEKEAGGDRFQVAAVNVDTGDDAKPKRFLSEIGVSDLQFYRENTLALFNDVKQRGLALGLPVTLLVDPEGCLLAHMNGPAEWASDDAKAWIAKAVGD